MQRTSEFGNIILFLKPVINVATSHFVRAQAQTMAKGTGCKGSYVLMNLPHHNRIKQVFPDAMHTIKVVIEHIFNLITGKEDSKKVRKAEIQLGRLCLQESTPDTKNNCSTPCSIPSITRGNKMCQQQSMFD